MIRSVGLRNPTPSVWDFHPSDLDTPIGAMFDATDEGTITESGGRVSQLDDLSGNGRHLTASGDARPWVGEDTTPNGSACLTFDGAQRLVNTSYTSLSSNYQVMVVAKFDAASDAVNASTVFDGITTRNTLYRGTTGDEPGRTVFGNGANQAVWTQARDQWRIYSCRRSLGFPNAITLWSNTQQVALGTPDGAVVFGGLSVGNIRGNPDPIETNYGHRGQVAALIAFENILGTGDMRNVLAWLSARTGVYPISAT